MSKQLIIAEKPSVAQDIARALGGFHKEKDYFESEHYVLSSAIGHLLELTVPEEYEVKRGKWSFAHLPVIPPHFALAPIEKTEDRLKLLTKLIKRKDVEGLINACDAGREGELIFNYIAQHSGNKKPVRRLWLQSMTQAAIKEGFASLREAAEVAGLRTAAVCRAESDWLVGINGTRAMTAFNSKTGGFHLTTVGRVQTPTLAIVVEREERIRKFVPRAYWELEGRFAGGKGEYAGRWFDEKFKKDENDEHAAAHRLWDQARAEAIRAACVGKPATATERITLSFEGVDSSASPGDEVTRFKERLANAPYFAALLGRSNQVSLKSLSAPTVSPESGTMVCWVEAVGTMVASLDDSGSRVGWFEGVMVGNPWRVGGWA